MPLSHPTVPEFGCEEAAITFAMWLRGEVKRLTPEGRQILARIAEITPDTLTNYTKGQIGTAPSFSKSLIILAALDGWREFWSRLIGPADTLPDQLRGAVSALDLAQPLLAEHPPSAECDEAIDHLLEIQRKSLEMIEALRLVQKVRARNGGSHP